MSDEITEPTRYEIENALEKIKGYWLPRPNESRQSSFNRAKQEYIKNLKRYIEVAEAIPLTCEDIILLDKKAKT
jgi:hypothetical protein